jgi:glucosamine kinase
MDSSRTSGSKVLPYFWIVILVADAGSSKTSWALLSPEQVSFYESGGINPTFQGKADILQVLRDGLAPEIPLQQVDEVRFYGASCSSSERTKIVSDSLSEFFPKSGIFVSHDLLGAAIALCEGKPGIACILGTGSNSCYYDGSEIISNVSSGGFILGDEGSGARIGVSVLRDFVRGNLPNDLAEFFRGDLGLSEAKVVKTLYGKKFPNQFLVRFAKTLHPWLGKLEYVDLLIRREFCEFYQNCLSKYPEIAQVPVHCTGSVGYYFQGLFRSVLAENNCIIGTIVQRPIEALAAYYKTKYFTANGHNP